MTATTAISDPRSEAGQDKVNILLVDDQPGKLLVYETILAELGVNLIKAHSGKEALDLLLRTDITVVLMDVSMPEIDGFELSRLRASSLCDDNWTKGIWIHDPRAGFFVADYSDLSTLRPGSRLRFRASGERIVESLTGDQVWLLGPALDPAEDGYPQPIEVMAR